MKELIFYVSIFAFHYWAARKFGYSFIWIILAVLAPLVSTIFLVYKVVRDCSMLNYPPIDEYMSKNPKSNSGRGIYCNQCGSNHIRSWGVSGPADTRRLHSCSACNSSLYRTGC